VDPWVKRVIDAFCGAMCFLVEERLGRLVSFCVLPLRNTRTTKK
jgi:hypothetical protein